jgi:hypothetical protein
MKLFMQALGATTFMTTIFCLTIIGLNLLTEGRAYMSEFCVGGALVFFLTTMRYEWIEKL